MRSERLHENCLTVCAIILFLAGHVALASSAPSSASEAGRATSNLERGEWLVEGLLRCYTCHSPQDKTKPGWPIVEGMKGVGRVYSEAPGRVNVARNITPHAETGIGSWSDETLARAIREGIGHDGRALSRAMPSSYFRELSDADLAAVIAYLRDQPAVEKENPPTVLPEEEQKQLAAELQPLQHPVAAIEPADTIAYGRYLTRVGQCVGCHTAWEAPRMPGVLAGGNDIDGIVSSNITPHLTGIGYSKQAFAMVMRTGKGGALSGAMPWQAYRHLPDRELEALFDFLHTLHPFSHLVSNAVPPTQCSVCGQKHGLGEHNRIEMPKGIEVEEGVLATYTGSYVLAEWDMAVDIALEDGVLFIQEDGRPRTPLVALSADRFIYSGAFAPIHFRRNHQGRVNEIVSEEVDDIVFERVVEASDD